MRYEGQAHELDLVIAPESLDRDELTKTFTERYFETWSYSPASEPVQLGTLRVIAIGRVAKLSFPLLDGGGRSLEQAAMGRREVYFAGAERETPVYQRALLPPEAVLRGPAIIEEDGSTTVVFPEWGVRVDDVGNIILESG